MRRRVWLLVALAGVALGCGTDGGPAVGSYKPGEQVDLNGDGQPDGVVIDSNGDGIGDGVDTNGDGMIDTPLPEPGSGTGGATTGGATGTANGTANGGSTGAGSNTTGGLNGNCEEITAHAVPTKPDMLIMLDRSGSMKVDNVNRWDPSVRAVKSITSQLDAKIRFGLMTFPADLMCEPTDAVCACTPGAVNVPVALNAATTIGNFLDSTQPSGGTPTGDSLEVALASLNPGMAGPDKVEVPKFVLLVTDGQPTCPEGGGSTVNAADIMQSDDAIDALLAKGVKTYVIGYNTKTNPDLASVLDDFAMHGATGTHRAVEDEASLLTEFGKIAGDIVSCSYVLDMAPDDPRYVLVTLDGKQLNLNQPDGWSITGKAVTLGGQACATLQDGKEHVLNVQVKCEVVQVI